MTHRVYPKQLKNCSYCTLMVPKGVLSGYPHCGGKACGRCGITLPCDRAICAGCQPIEDAYQKVVTAIGLVPKPGELYSRNGLNELLAELEAARTLLEVK